MADDPGVGELYRILQAHQRTTDAQVAALNAEVGQRVRQDVFEIVRAGMSAAVEDARARASDELRAVKEDVADIAARSRRGRAEFLAWASVVLALVAVVVTVYGATRHA